MCHDWLRKQYRGLILEGIQKVLPHIDNIEIKIDGTLNEEDPRVFDILHHFSEKKKQQRKLPRKNEVKIVEGITSKILNPKYSFGNFIVGSSCRLAHAACMAVAKKPGTNYNPLFVYGKVGLGKTHLLQAIGNEILKKDANKYVAYVTSEDFTNEVVEAIRKQSTKKLRDRYRKLDVFIIDDIQFIANKDRTQEEFFHTFNSLYEAGKQVIISSDRPPSELDILEPRLRSRFEMGMIADVSQPDYETRLAILQYKAAQQELLVQPEVLELMAYNIQSNIRELEGILMQIVAQYELEEKMPTIQSVTEILKRHRKENNLVGFEPEKPKDCINDIEELIRIVSKHYAVPEQEVIGHSRVREFVIPRQVAMYLAKKKMNMAVTKIGDMFDGRDHTSVLHAVKKIDKQIQNDQQLMRNMNAIKEHCGFL
jgi:chromosomal replication initiator protein